MRLAIDGDDRLLEVDDGIPLLLDEQLDRLLAILVQLVVERRTLLELELVEHVGLGQLRRQVGDEHASGRARPFDDGEHHGLDVVLAVDPALDLRLEEPHPGVRALDALGVEAELVRIHALAVAQCAIQREPGHQVVLGDGPVSLDHDLREPDVSRRVDAFLATTTDGDHENNEPANHATQSLIDCPSARPRPDHRHTDCNTPIP
jgi:hypothetical protein